MIPGSVNPYVRIILGKIDPTLVCCAEVEGPNYLVKGGDVYLWWDGIGQVRMSEGKLLIVEPVRILEDLDEINLIPFYWDQLWPFYYIREDFWFCTVVRL
jgi:hypothetical protein